MTRTDHARRQGPLLPIIHGMTALFLGIGLARFSFSPVIPLLVRDEWYSANQAQMLGAWGLAGYLLGCFIAQRLARLVPINLLTGLLATSIVISFWVCSYPVAYPVAALLRLISGGRWGGDDDHLRLGCDGAAAQAAISFVASGTSHAFGSYRPVFWACALALLLGVLCTLIAGRQLQRAEEE